MSLTQSSTSFLVQNSSPSLSSLVVERFPFKISVGGGWGRIGASQTILISSKTVQYARNARLVISSGVAIPFAGEASITFNGRLLARSSSSSEIVKAHNVSALLSTENTVSIEIYTNLPMWLGGTVVEGVLEVEAAYPSQQVAREAERENKTYSRSYAPASPLTTLAYFIPFILIAGFVWWFIYERRR